MKVVMIVDDCVENRFILKNLFSDDYQIIEACSGQEAAFFYEKKKIDLIISDLQMPNGDGFWLLNYLKGKKTTIPPVIIISGHPTIEATDLLKAGAVAFFPKPFDVGKLKSFLSQM